MRRIGLTGRIWLSLGVFVLGYLLSVAVAQVQGLHSEGGLRRTNDALFPAAQLPLDCHEDRLERFGPQPRVEPTAYRPSSRH